jgi:hypothetical protein
MRAPAIKIEKRESMELVAQGNGVVSPPGSLCWSRARVCASDAWGRVLRCDERRAERSGERGGWDIILSHDDAGSVRLFTVEPQGGLVVGCTLRPKDLCVSECVCIVHLFLCDCTYGDTQTNRPPHEGTPYGPACPHILTFPFLRTPNMHSLPRGKPHHTWR